MKKRFPIILSILLLTACSTQQQEAVPLFDGKAPQTGNIESVEALPQSDEEFAVIAEAPTEKVEEILETPVEERPAYSTPAPVSRGSYLSTVPATALVINANSWSEIEQAVANTDNTFIQATLPAGENYWGSYQWTTPLSGKILQIVGNNTTINGSGASGYSIDFLPNDGRGKIELTGITFTNFANGVRVSGGYEYKGVPEAYGIHTPLTAIVENCSFINIGEAYAGGAGYAAVHLQNTSGNIVASNTFVNNVNYNKPANIHAIYMVLSHGTSIVDNVFENVSGDPVRLRNQVSGVYVDGNVFTDCGRYGLVSDWFCGSSCTAKNNQGMEYPSEEPIFGNNTNNSYVPLWTRT